MLKDLKPILLGLLLFLVLNVLVTVGFHLVPGLDRKFGLKVDNFLPQKLDQIASDTSQPPNILFLGTSQTNNGFVPSAFEQTVGQSVRSFNMGLPGTRYDVMMTYLEYHTLHVGKPRLVLLEVTDALVEPRDIYFYLPALHYRTLMEKDTRLMDFAWRNPLMAFEVRQELVCSALSVLHQYRSITNPLSVQKKVLKTLKRLLFGSNEADAAEVSPPVSVTLPVITSEMTATGWIPKAPSPIMETPGGAAKNAVDARKYYIDPLPDLNFAKFNAILTYCRQRNIPVVLVQWPNHPEYLRIFEASHLYQPYHQGLKEVIKTHQVPFVDLNWDNPEAVTGLYSDSRHLSPAGALKFSAILGERVRELGVPGAVGNSGS